MKNRGITTVLALVVSALSSPALSQEFEGLPPQRPVLPPPPMPDEEDSRFVIYPLRNNTFMISGPSSNVMVQIGYDGVLLVDTGSGDDVTGLLRQIRRLSDKPIRYILNTNGDPDHTGANALLPQRDPGSIGFIGERPTFVAGYGSIPILAHEQVMFSMSADEVFEGIPTLTYFVEQKDIHFNGEPISLIHAPGHTAGDSLVMLRRSDVIAAGDTYTPDRYPDIDVERGGSISDYLASLNRLIGLTVTEFNQEGGTLVMPGHGRLSDEGDIGEYRDMVTFIRDRVATLIERGMTLSEITAARPTFDYDPLFGQEAGEVFVEQIYRSLMQEGE